MDHWEEKLEELIAALKASETNLNEGRPPTREVVSKLMERTAEEDLT